MLTLPVEIMPPAETTINRVLANRSFRLANSTTEKMGDHNRIPSAAVELIRQLETLGLFDRIIAEKS